MQKDVLSNEAIDSNPTSLRLLRMSCGHLCIQYRKPFSILKLRRLTDLSGYSELLQTTNLDQEQLGYINLIKSATKALSLITDSVLDFSKLENDNLESQAKPSRVEIRKLVADCVRQCYMRKDHRSQNVTLLCLIDDNVPETCWVDEVYLSRVVFNLCGNSLKFTSEGFGKCFAIVHHYNMNIADQF